MSDAESQTTEAKARALKDVENQAQARDVRDFASFVRQKAQEIVREAQRWADETQEPAGSTVEPRSEPQPDVISIKVNLSRPAWEALQSMSKTYGTSITDALHQAISTEYAVAQAKSRTVWSRMMLRRPA